MRFLVLALFLMTGCAQHFQPQFSAYESTNRDEVFKGSSGIKTTHNGIDIWTEGRPNKNYIIVGMITDTRPSGRLATDGLNDDLVEEAKARGCDAIILSESSIQQNGFVMVGYSAVAIGNRTTKAIAIKYVSK